MKNYRVTLAASERAGLEQLLACGKADVRKLKHAQNLLKADEATAGPAWGDLSASPRRSAPAARPYSASGSASPRGYGRHAQP